MNNSLLEDRKQQEKAFHDLVRSEDVQHDAARCAHLCSNRKYYAIHRKQATAVERWWAEHVPQRRVLDYCTGGGQFAAAMARHHPSQIVGIDISDVSVQNARNLVHEEGVADRCEFRVMDAEAMEFSDNSFDIVHERGSLHHLDLHKAYAEIARVLKPGGKALCAEALVHNPVIHLYRKLTPHLRTAWEVEHILGKRDIQSAEAYFHRVDIVGFFHLATLLAVPFRGWKYFDGVLGALERVDDVVLKCPRIKWHAWSVVFVLSEPRK